MSHFEKLVKIMNQLRGPDGCPWDREQTHQTLKSYLLEEAYEVLEAIDNEDDDHLKEELGDLLLQVVFHAQIAQESSRFDIEDVANSISEKLIRRHPHVFGSTEVKNSDQVVTNWESIKSQEKTKKGHKTSALSGIPKQFPALLRASRMQDRASRAGFDPLSDQPDEIPGFLENLLIACGTGEIENIRKSFGELLFRLIHLAQKHNVNPEDALTQVNDSFLDRFTQIEEQLEDQGKSTQTVPNETLIQLWNSSRE